MRRNRLRRNPATPRAPRASAFAIRVFSGQTSAPATQRARRCLHLATSTSLMKAGPTRAFVLAQYPARTVSA